MVQNPFDPLVNVFITHNQVLNGCVGKNIPVILHADGGINRNLNCAGLQNTHVEKIPLRAVVHHGGNPCSPPHPYRQ